MRCEHESGPALRLDDRGEPTSERKRQTEEAAPDCHHEPPLAWSAQADDQHRSGDHDAQVRHALKRAADKKQPERQIETLQEREHRTGRHARKQHAPRTQLAHKHARGDTQHACEQPRE